MADQIIYSGHVQIYLQGKNALVPLTLNDDQLTCAIGSDKTDLIVHDHREKPIQVVQQAMPGTYPLGFANAFNQSAWAEVRYTPIEDGLDIRLFEPTESKETPILWMGILDRNTMPAYMVEWEIFKLLNDQGIAFCALILAQP